MSTPEQTAEQGDHNSGLNEHLKENKAAGETFKAVHPLCIFVGAVGWEGLEH